MKRWIKLEILPLIAALGWIFWLLGNANLPAWMSVVAVFTFCLVPAAAGIFYGHAVAMAGGGGFDFIAHVKRQQRFSRLTFGPGAKTAAVIDHIRKELVEIEAKPHDLVEWVDVILLALDGAWRAGHRPGAIAAAIQQKQARNESRKWPDWRAVPPNQAIQPIRAEIVDTTKGGA